ncbi:diguanylate cyclase [Peptoclostridium acidaminophilum DSM 3953]|uniref:Diguanylate cyclase n=1 Tax=Peptoclostridium acidaminophilum DSM 3953 TaxID=1286171 RepID=W8T958_PEPAC|nr:GGDEF domain-containing protein [Peptoclostridium acidaminophilum]AHM57445.1 diguanylate cyclase [Peptoclostridium acidaminophilum DSM 3953]
MSKNTKALFKEELEKLQKAQAICNDHKNNANELIDEFRELVAVFERNLKTTIKLTSISDGQQVYLKEVQAELAREIEERKRQQELLEYYAFTDMMTGVPNRINGFMALDRELKRLQNEDTYFSICFIDIDGLKSINDGYGHIEGDFIIRTFADVIKESIGEADVISRIGGDEFLLLLPEKTKSESEAVIKTVFEKIESFNSLQTKPYDIGFSYGIMEINRELGMDCTDKIISAADSLMYRNKTLKKEIGLCE